MIDENKNPVTGNVSDKKRQAIIDAAISEFIEHGFQKASMDRISVQADVSKRTVYKHFESKEKLFGEISKRIFNEALEATEYEYTNTVSLELQLTHIAQQETQLITSAYYVDASRMLMAEHMLNPQLGLEALAKVITLESGLKRWLKSAVQDNALSITDFDLAASQFFSLLKSVMYWPQIVYRRQAPEKQEQDTIIASAVRMFLAEYRSKG